MARFARLLAMRGDVGAMRFLVCLVATYADVFQHPVRHGKQAVAFALNIDPEALLLHPVTDYLRHAVEESDLARGDTASAILGTVSHNATYQCL
jgi:hypothetical protein